MQFTPIWIVTLIAYLITVIGLGFLAKITAKPVDSYAFSFKRVFPFEVLNHSDRPLPYKAFLCLFVAASFAPIFNLFTSYGQIANIEGISIAICCTFGLASICFAFLHYFDATHTMVHLVLFVLFLCLSLLGCALATIKGIAVYNVYAKHDEKMYCSLIGAIISGICGLMLVILSVNPKLKNWANLQKVDSGYERPKVFILAYYEWLTFFILAVGEAAYFLVLLVQ